MCFESKIFQARVISAGHGNHPGANDLASDWPCATRSLSASSCQSMEGEALKPPWCCTRRTGSGLCVTRCHKAEAHSLKRTHLSSTGWTLCRTRISSCQWIRFVSHRTASLLCPIAFRRTLFTAITRGREGQNDGLVRIRDGVRIAGVTWCHHSPWDLFFGNIELYT